MRAPGLPVRRQYLRMAGRALAEGKVDWTIRQGLNTALGVPLSAAVGRPLGGPIMGSLVVTYRCNNACFMCDLPKPWFYKQRGSEEFGTDELKRVIDDYAELGTAGITVTGGEPTLRPDCFELVAHARRVGLAVNLNTNAYTLSDRARVRALLDSGVDSLNISVDGSRSATHDRLRGIPGGLARVEEASRLILEERAARGSRKPTITYVFVVGPENHGEAVDFVDLAERAGVDAVGFMPLFDVYKGHRAPTAEAVAGMERTIDRLRELKQARGEFIDNSDDYLSLFPRSWRGEASPLKCYVGYQHVAVDAYGNVFPCALWFHQGRAIGNVTRTRLRDLWRSDAYQDARGELSACHACYWNCHSEMSLLYQRAPR